MRGAVARNAPTPLGSTWRSHPEESAYYKRNSGEILSIKADKATRQARARVEEAKARTSKEQRQARWKALGWIN